MEIGYLWLTLTLFLFLMTTGAAIVLAAVAFPLVRQADEEDFAEAFRHFRRRKWLSYGVLWLLSLALCGLLSVFPPYSFPDASRNWMACIVGLILLISLGWWRVSRKLEGEGSDTGHHKKLGVLLWADALLWLAGSCLLVWVFVTAVGLR